MCNATENENAPYMLVQHMMTPFEKSRILNLEEAKSLEIKEETTDKLSRSITYCSHERIMSAEVLNKLFGLDKVSVDDNEKEFVFNKCLEFIKSHEKAAVKEDLVCC